ncbi:MAG: GAF domain-containing protein [Synechococcaceae cyanobacterium SM2_3_60]|nr:GAF domain-containing protein [Synechococcaceae cyanobacterium SM2_3_60]
MVNTASSSYLVDLDTLLVRMRESDDPAQLATWVIEFISTTFAPTLIWLATYDDYHHQMIGQGGICLMADYAPLRSPVPLDPGSLIEQVVIEQQLITIPDLPQETRMGRWQQESKQLGVQGCLLVPICFKRRTFGLVLMGTQAWGAFIDDNEKALLGMLLGQYAASLYHIEQTWQQQATKQAAAPLLNLGNAIRQGNTLDERLRIALDHIRHLYLKARPSLRSMPSPTSKAFFSFCSAANPKEPRVMPS